MNSDLVDRIVEATLYEGYILYPYRPSSAKNRVRWNFGAVHPRSYSEACRGTEPWELETECLLSAPDEAELCVRLRFLQVVTRTVGAPRAGPDGADGEIDPTMPVGFVAVDSLRVGDAVHVGWEEAAERSAEGGPWSLAGLLERPRTIAVELPGTLDVETLVDAGVSAGAAVRRCQPIEAEAVVRATRVAPGTVRVGVEVRNTAEAPELGDGDRAASMLRALVSTHVVLTAAGGRFVSLTDPPASLAEAAAACTNRGLWPVLVDAEDDTVLAAPIILEDHPRVAPESPGELFDSTEIDEILSLRILTLTDDEKAEMRAADPRARALLERTEAMDAADLGRLHGAIRELRPHEESE